MRVRALLLAVAVSFGVTSVEVLPMTSDRLAPVARAEAGEPGRVAEGLDRLVGLVLQRLETGDAVAAAKWATAQASGSEPVIDDPAREAEVYDSMARAGAELGLPGGWVRQVFLGQIEASKMVQHGLIARWRFDPATVPTTPPNLAAVRPVIDRVNGEILRELAAHRAELSGSHCVVRLASSVFPMLTSGRADSLHQAALVRATAALCGPA
ncbi:gamma subclass chorismate mutase AroQ [Nocardia transvalensis]|uniref:gamma subclass chorismate mutase AroQ n=1 Tax=Nocardia transvalensis TaxID=37333 RepID=UPI001895F5A3|nr:gamma subclass chorismate mutase AroQ [Nocardia transvalensis]MBF6328664.1 gamma subclass chorismate mutase AroQ [Nocardia transvalensis]